jgi:integrase
MPVVKLTLPFLKNVTLPIGKQVFYFDESMSRFGVSVFPSGRKTFFIKYQNEYGKPKWLKIGQFPIMTLEQAREAARSALVKVDLNKDPANEKQGKRHAKTVSELCDLYLEIGVAHKKPTTIASDKGRIETLIKPLIGAIPVEALNRTDVTTMMTDIIKGEKIHKHEPSGKPRGIRRVTGGSGAAARTIQTLGAIMTFAKDQGFISENPVQGVKKPKDKVRDIFLTWDEVRALGRILALPQIQQIYPHICTIIPLLLLTGCRRNEILELRWEYIDFENQVFRFPDTKTGKQNRPFGVAAKKLLQNIKNLTPHANTGWVFPSVRGDSHITNLLKTFKTICATRDEHGQRILNRDDLTLHALRHTFATLGSDLGYVEITMSALLGHRLGTVTSRYTHAIDKSLILAANDISLALENALQNKEG